MKTNRKKRWIRSAGALLTVSVVVGSLIWFAQGIRVPESFPSRAAASITTVPGAEPPSAHPDAPLAPEKGPLRSWEALPAEAQLDAAARKRVVEKLSQVLAEQYVYKDRGDRMAEWIRSRLKDGAYDGIRSPIAFAEALQADLHKIIRDKHLGIRYEPLPTPSATAADVHGSPAPGPRLIASDSGMLPEVRILDGNIGYMAVNAMSSSEAAERAIAAAFALLHQTEALVIDVRGNTGGSPAIVSLIEGYLSEGGSYVTNVVHWRNVDRPEQLRTTDVGKLSYGDPKPVYVLTSPTTFSAAEQLSYDLQAFKRAVIVGEMTGGGSHVSNIGPVSLGHGLVANVPTGYLVNVVTGTNWEETGVQPDVSVPAQEALTTAWSLAARKLAESAADPATKMWLALFSDAKLSGDPGFDAAALVGEYFPIRGGGPAMPAVVHEKDGKLYVQMQTSSGARDAALVSVGGDRYALDGYPAGFSCTFVKQEGKIRLLLASGPGDLTILGK
jgi:hypothetical protein